MNQDHAQDQELVLEADGELSAWRAFRLRRHLRACEQCRARKAALEASMGELIRLHQAGADRLPPSEAPRSFLRAGLAAESARGQRWLVAGAGASAALLAVWLLTPAGRSGRNLLPDPGLTPGATISVSATTLCSASEEEAPPVEPAVARLVFQRYGIREPAPRMYELDYLITPALGGARDSLNLWPQPYSSGEWNSRVKDALEDRLRELVCAGRLDLATAQRELAEDWIAAYQRHFGVGRPLLDHIAFVKDPPWE